MDYRLLWKEENEAVRERYGLAVERIREMESEETVEEPFREYFRRTAAFIGMMDQLRQLAEDGSFREQSLDEMKAWNHRLYEDILPGQYETSFANPAYAHNVSITVT